MSTQKPETPADKAYSDKLLEKLNLANQTPQMPQEPDESPEALHLYIKQGIRTLNALISGLDNGADYTARQKKGFLLLDNISRNINRLFDQIEEIEE